MFSHQQRSRLVFAHLEFKNLKIFNFKSVEMGQSRKSVNLCPVVNILFQISGRFAEIAWSISNALNVKD